MGFLTGALGRTPPAFTLSTWLWLPLPRADVFDFFADATNLQRLTPALLNFRILTTMPITMEAGTIIDYRIAVRGIPLTWRTEITAWDPPHSFIDTQRRGPYREWVHTHAFEEHDGGTLVRDQVRYRLPGPSVLARLVNKLVVARDVTGIFQFRQTALQQALGITQNARLGPITLLPPDP